MVALDARGVVLRCLNLTSNLNSGINFFCLTVREIGGLPYLTWSKHVGLKCATPHVQRMKPF
jgi:hypothetical protein